MRLKTRFKDKFSLSLRALVRLLYISTHLQKKR
jgi:hypothetical protein